MKSLIKKTEGIFLMDVPEEVLKDKHVKIKVNSIGLCRTDLLVANGMIPVDFDIVLGHEFSGTVEDSMSEKFKKGDRVTVNPCFDNGFMGLDFNGCIQEFVIIPEKQIIKNNKVSDNFAAYLEPVSASMAVLKACKDKNAKGAVWGKNRIAELTYIILKSEGYNVDWISQNSVVEESSYDYIVETLFEEKTLKDIIKALKLEGTIIVKSRKKQATALTAFDLVSKELTLKCVNYYSFEESMKWLENNYTKVEHLLGSSYHIDQWEEAFKEANSAESKKIFIHF